jgi:hypothetical protein
MAIAEIASLQQETMSIWSAIVRSMPIGYCGTAAQAEALINFRVSEGRN